MNIIKNIKIIKRAISFEKLIASILCIIYTFVSFGLSGVPRISRISFISSILLVLLLIPRLRVIRVQPWLILISIFYLYLIIPGIFATVPAWDTIYGATTILIGTACIGIILTNRLISPKIIAYTMMISVFVNIIGILMGIDMTPDEYRGLRLDRMSGFIGNSNTLSINFSLAALAIWLFIPNNWIIKFVSITTACYGVYISGSRKGVILIGSLLLLISKKYSECFSKIGRTVFMITTGSVIIIIYKYYENINQLLIENVLAFRRISMMFESKADLSILQREWLFNKGIEIWQSSPLFGEGLGQFAYISGFGAFSHNNYIELLVAGGLVAFILYYSIYMYLLYYGFKNGRNWFFYGLLIVGTMLIIDIVAVSFYDRATMLFIALIIATISDRQQYMFLRSK